MTTQTEALKLALDALEDFDSLHGDKTQKAITAIKKALMSQSDGAQHKQEPVAWVDLTNDEIMGICRDIERRKYSSYDILCEVSTRLKKLNTQPQRKPWVSLTDEDAASIAHKGFDDYWTEDCKGRDVEAWTASGRAIEAKLRKLNEAPQRPSRSDMTWVGLTDTEKCALANDVAQRGVPVFEAICEAEAKLKEKNT